jgi:hypothetical protein
MSKFGFLRMGTTLAIAMGMFWNVTAQTLTLDLQNCPKPVTSDGYWTDTYSASVTSLTCGDFVFSHSSMGGSPSSGYWDGSIYSINGDSARYGIPCPVQPCDTAHSVPWLEHQWGVMAGGGLTTPPTVVKGAPYLVAYWGYYTEPASHTVQISLSDNSLFSPQEIYICNHPWPYWGNIYGDGFARPLNKRGDHFYLWIHAVKNNNAEDSIRVILANNPTGTNLVQPRTWQQVSLTNLGNDIKSIYFTMESTDSDPIYGPNTAVYFNLDKLKVTKTGGVAASPAITRKTETAAPKAVEVKDNFPIPSYTGGEVTVFDTKGKEVLKTTVKAGEKVNLSKLPKGEYRLRHGHKHIPVIKK